MPSDTASNPSTTALPQRGWPPPPVHARARTAAGVWSAWPLASIASIWIAVVVISLFSPDMVTGSEHQRLPVAALGTWIWGLRASTDSVLPMPPHTTDVDRRRLETVRSAATIAIWGAAALVSIFGPTVVTGSDPTTIPLAAMISPIAAALATKAVGTFVREASRLSDLR